MAVLYQLPVVCLVAAVSASTQDTDGVLSWVWGWGGGRLALLNSSNTIISLLLPFLFLFIRIKKHNIFQSYAAQAMYLKTFIDTVPVLDGYPQ